MPGLTLGIGETNPKKGAVQFDGRRIDGVQFSIPAGAGVSSAPIGSIVTLQEDVATGKQRIVLGAAALESDMYATYAIIAVGFLEAASQTDNQIDQTVGSYIDGDYASMISDTNAVASVPAATGYVPNSGGTAYITAKGELSSSSASAVAFPGAVWKGTAGIQNKGQLKTGNIFARLKSVTVG